ncbi:hypothetical protein BsWGS_09319 [Bradybaena similaris]
MGNTQSHQQQDHMSYLAISPSPLVSIVKRPHHRLSESVKSSSSNRSSSSAQGSEGSTTHSRVVRRVEHKACQDKSLKIQDVRLPDWISHVACENDINCKSRGQLIGCLSRDSACPSRDSACPSRNSAYPSTDSACPAQDSRQKSRRDLHGRIGRTCSKVNIDEVNTNTVHTSDAKVYRDCIISLHENRQSLKQHTKLYIPTCTEVNISEADTSEVNTTSANSNEVNTTSANSDEVNTSRNCIDSFRNHHCTRSLLQHKCADSECIDNVRLDGNTTKPNAVKVNTTKLNTAEENTTKPNTAKVKTNKVNSNNNCSILYGQQNIVVQDTDRTSYAVKSSGANTNTSCNSSRHQQNCGSTKSEVSHSPADSCDTFVKVEKISAAYISPSDVSKEKLVQYCLKKDKEEDFVTGHAICQLSVTELSLEEMTEADQHFGRGYLDSLSEENQLVERGGSFKEQDRKGGEEKTAGGRTLISSHNDAWGRQIDEGDSRHGQDEKLLRVTTDTATSQENRINNGQLKCGRKFSSTASSNHAVDTNHVRCSDSSTSSNTATSDRCSDRSTSSNTASSDRCSDRSTSSNTATSDSPHLRCTFSSKASLIATPNGHDFNSQLQTCPISLGSNSTCEPTLQTSAVYVHPTTGDFHSMVFGPLTGGGTSLSGCSRTFSQTQVAPEPTGYSISHSDVSFGTGSFISVLREMADNPSCDFKPDGQLSVHVGRVGPFDSFRDSVSSCSLEQNHCRSKVQADPNAEEFAQSVEAEKGVLETQQTSLIESGGSSEHSQACSRPRTPTSSCHFCTIANSCMEPVFGCTGGSLCQMCSISQQSLAKDTNSFSGIASSEYKSQQSCDSWQTAGITQAINSCFVDYDSDSGQFSDGHEQQQQEKSYCKCEAEVANKSTSHMFLNTGKEIETCEAATEHFGFDSKRPISPKFGDRFLTFCSNIFKTQLVAENEIRGMDTGEFNDNCAPHSTSSLTTRQNKPMPDSFSHSNKHKHVTPAGMGCGSASERFLEKADQVKAEDKSPAKSSPRSKQFNPSTFTSSDTRGQVWGPLCVPAYDLPDNTNWPHDDVDDSSSDLDDSSRGNKHQSSARSKGQSSRRGALGTNKTRAQEPEMIGARIPCALRMQHSRSLSCDCSDPFRQNYVAYLLCATEDLSSFGLTFHRMLESWGFRIFIAPRDLELTGPKYDNMARWLEDRCNGKIIVVLSKNYEKSDECLFLTYFARTLDPDSKYRNIIPVVIDKDVEIPNVLKGLSIIKYNYDFRCGWLKKKLVNAIAA